MRRIVIILTISASLYPCFAGINGSVRIAAIRVSFMADETPGTTGNGSFLLNAVIDTCGRYTIDPVPHDRAYFESQLVAVNNYYRSVSYGKFGLDLDQSTVFPQTDDGSYILPEKMDYYHPYNQTDLHDQRVTELFRDAIETAYNNDEIDFSNYDHVVVFHAGIGQDFSLPFLDPTPEDIPSTFIDGDMLQEYVGGVLQFGTATINQGIILPETQNHLFYQESENIFLNTEEPCDYQYGLTGTFALMLGFAIGLPPLWDTNSGQSGIGIFGLMDQGSNNGRGLIPSPPDAWSRKFAGWELPLILTPSIMINLPSRSEDNLVQIPINETEYFLIENRTNWYQGNMYIDSTRYLIYKKTERYPPFVEVLFDSVAIEKDENGVVTAIPDYDLGLPASGLLIWHIDENKIFSGLDNYLVNGDRENRGVDLEEADGAQDIGFPSIFLFSDPSAGYFGDVWFKGNPEYERANPSMEGLAPEFGTFTYPSTVSNEGASTFITIGDISFQADTMSFTIYSSLLADGFPDTSLHIGLVYDFDNDGVMEIVGGKDSVWFAQDEDVLNEQYFYSTNNEVYDFAVGDFDGSNQLLIFERDSTTSFVFHFAWDANQKDMILQSTNSFTAHTILFVNDTLGNHQYLQKPNERFVSTWIINKDGYIDSINQVSLLSAADLNLDGEAEYLYIDYQLVDIPNFYGALEAKHMNGVTVSGFPLYHYHRGQTALIKNLYGDDHPEIVVRNDNGEIIVINWQGQVEYRLTDYGDLVCLSEYDGRNAIVTASAIWFFDEVSENNGNEWTSTHHDFGNTRTLHLNISKRIPDSALIDKGKTYAYPNPVYDDHVYFRVAVESAERIEIMIYDLAGYFIKQINFEGPLKGAIEEKSWRVGDIEPGVYFANVTAWSGDQSETKVLKVAVIH